MRTRHHVLHLMTNREWFESANAYVPDETYYMAPVRALLPPDWSARHEGVWFHCLPPGAAMPVQGWKIHISGTTHSAAELIAAVVPVLAAGGVPFKCAADRILLSLINSKRWSRGGSGKFITVYPRDVEHFTELLPKLAAATAGFVGPYILSDRRYRDSGVVFYRYGTLQAQTALAVDGTRVPVLVNADGTLATEERGPLFCLPPGVEDPVTGESATMVPGAGAPLLRDGRYRIDAPLAFSNSGGVYLAGDTTTGATVVLKEARPYTNWLSRDDDATALLRKEHRILGLVADRGYSAKPVELFTEWEHTFVAQEHVAGVSLAALGATRSVLLRTRPARGDAEAFLDLTRRVFTSLLHALEAVHAANVVFGDLSPSNVLWREDLGRVALIDFEGACEIGVDRPANLTTPGFDAPGTGPATVADVADDWYAYGALLCAFLMPITPFFALAPERAGALVERLCAASGLPREIAALIQALLRPERERRAGPAQIAQALRSLERMPSAPSAQLNFDPGRDFALEPLAPEPLPVDLRERLAAYIIANADPRRTDRLYPADFRVFDTNPLSVAYGAAGVIYALHCSGITPPTEHVAWLLRTPVTPQRYPPGLMLGSSGIAWTLLALGAVDDARRVLACGHDHPLRDRAPGLAYGKAGWALTNLAFFLALDDERYLAEAHRCGGELVREAARDERGLSWAYDGDVHYGLYHGASGVALFLTYLALASNDERFLAAARDALRFDLAHAQPIENGRGVSWPYRAGFPGVLLPYWSYGSAGIGAALLRLVHLGGAGDLAPWLERIFVDTDRAWSVTPGMANGLAGIATFLVDAHAFTGEARYRDAALRALDGILAYRVARGDGIALPGDYSGRLSCDYATGSAGALSLVDRIVRGGPADFFLDQHFILPVQRSPAAV
jgi:hypothetical protein